MAEHDPALVEKAVRAAVAHQRIPTLDDDAGGHRCSGCDHLRGESDGANSPRHVEHQVRAVLDAVAPAIREATVPLIRRAVLDPGSFVDRGPDYEGNARGERIDHWQNRAIHAALRDMAGQQREEQADG